MRPASPRMGENRRIDVGVLAVLAGVAVVGAARWRSPRLLAVAAAAAGAEVAYRRWVARSSSAAAQRLRFTAGGPTPDR